MRITIRDRKTGCFMSYTKALEFSRKMTKKVWRKLRRELKNSLAFRGKMKFGEDN